MILKKIVFHNFRNFEEKAFSFNPFLTLVVGENTRGKTNLIEGIYFLITGTGFREDKEEELITFFKNRSLVEATFQAKDSVFDYQINLIKRDKETVKRFYLNKVEKKLNQYREANLKTVLFNPEQIAIIIGQPAHRRDYLNKIISAFDFDYKKHLVNFDNALKKRNKILEKNYQREKLEEELFFWNHYLEKEGSYLTTKRKDYLDFLNCYQTVDGKTFKVDYLKNEFSQKRLKESFSLERKMKRTVIGPQKDDFQLFLKEKDSWRNIHRFGSRSEQRLALLWLKLGELKFYEESFQIKPLLLLDDIFSELDRKNQQLIFSLIKKYQTVATATEINLVNLVEIPKTLITL